MPLWSSSLLKVKVKEELESIFLKSPNCAISKQKEYLVKDIRDGGDSNFFTWTSLNKSKDTSHTISSTTFSTTCWKAMSGGNVWLLLSTTYNLSFQQVVKKIVKGVVYIE